MRIYKYLIILSLASFILFGSLSYLRKRPNQDLTVLYELKELTDSLQKNINKVDRAQLDNLQIHFSQKVAEFSELGKIDSLNYYQTKLDELIDLTNYFADIQAELSFSREQLDEYLDFSRFQEYNDSLLMQIGINESELLFDIECRIDQGLQQINNYICCHDNMYLSQLINEEAK